MTSVQAFTNVFQRYSSKKQILIDNIMLGCFILFVGTAIADLAIGFDNYSTTCHNDLFRFSPVTWLLTNGFLGVLFVVVFYLISLVPKLNFVCVYILPYLFSWVWTIVGSVMVWSSDNSLACNSNGVRNTLWASVIVNICSGFVITICLICWVIFRGENHNGGGEQDQEEIEPASTTVISNNEHYNPDDDDDDDVIIMIQ